MRICATRPPLRPLLILAFGLPVIALASSLANHSLSAQLVPAKPGTAGVASRNPAALYASVGEELIEYSADVPAAKLVRLASISLPASVQEGWLHPSGRYLYVAWSNRGTSDAKANGEKSGVTAFRVRPDGILQTHGAPLRLISRPVYITGDINGTHILVAYNDPSGIAVYSIAPDGTLGAEVKPAGSLNVGVYGHQVRVNPSNNSVILVTRGNKPAQGKREDPGAVKIMSYHDGVLANLA